MNRSYINIARRWLWLVLLAAIVTTAATYLFVKDEPTIYEANTKLIVGPGVDSPDPDLNALRAGGQLMQTYAEIADTGPFFEAIAKELNLEVTPDKLRKMIDVRSNQETQILSITVKNENPELAIAIANAAAVVLVRMSPAGSDNPTALLRERMQEQAAKLEGTIVDTETVINQLESDLANLTSDPNRKVVIIQSTSDAEQRSLIIEQLTRERARLSDALSALTTIYESLQKTPTNQVKIIEQATSSPPIVSNIRLQVLMGGIAGLLMAIVIIMAFEYFNDSFKTPEELVQAIGIPALVTIPEHKKLAGTGSDRLVVQALPDTSAAESYRLLGTKLIIRKANELQEHSLEDQQDWHTSGQLDTRKHPILGSIMISSLQEEFDMSEIAANIAVVLGQAGQQVVLVDANLHDYEVSRLFGFEDHCGLTDILSGQIKDPATCLVELSSSFSVLPVGKLRSAESGIPSSFERLASVQMSELIEEFKKEGKVVIIASPPLLSFADSLILASRVDGVLAAISSNKTYSKGFTSVIENLRSLDVRWIGAVLDLNTDGSMFSNLVQRLPLLQKNERNVDERHLLAAKVDNVDA